MNNTNTTQQQVERFKWKNWYWYFALLSNNLPSLFLIILMILLNQLSLSQIQPAVFYSYIGILPFLVLLCTFTYLYATWKNYQAKKFHIKNKRLNSLMNGLIFNVLIFMLYSVGSILVYYLFAKEIPTLPSSDYGNAIMANTNLLSGLTINGFAGIFLALMLILGFFASSYWTYFEFCIAFDVFAKKNSKIIEAWKKRKEQEEQNKVNWVELANKFKKTKFKNGSNKWTSSYQIEKNKKELTNE